MRSSVCLFILMLIVCGCATQPTVPQQVVLHEKEFVGTLDDAYKGITSVLQNQGYIIKTSDYNGGFLSAESKLSNVPWFGGWTYLYETTVSIEKISEKAVKVKIAMVKNVFVNGHRTSNTFYKQLTAGPVQDSKIYDDLYNEIEKEMLRRAH